MYNSPLSLLLNLLLAKGVSYTTENAGLLTDLAGVTTV